jgi:transposase
LFRAVSFFTAIPALWMIERITVTLAPGPARNAHPRRRCWRESPAGSMRRASRPEANLKRFRAIATRYDKTARNFLALVQLACARLWLEN